MIRFFGMSFLSGWLLSLARRDVVRGEWGIQFFPHPQPDLSVYAPSPPFSHFCSSASLRHDDQSTIPKARKLAEQVLGEGWEKKAEGVYKEGTGKIHIWGIGHCESFFTVFKIVSEAAVLSGHD